MPYIGNQPSESFTSFATQEFSTSATTSYTLDHAVTNENEIALFVNNVRQQPGSGKAYTASGTTLTLSAATASTDTMYCVFLGRALQTVTPATNSITAAMVSNDLISGKDALTSAPADTDEFLISDAGVLKRIDASLVVGGGKVLQVITATDSTKRTTNSTSYVTASNTLSIDITPSSTSSKVFLIGSISVYQTNGDAAPHLTIYRDSTELSGGTSLGGFRAGDGNQNMMFSPITHLDSPSSTSQITYQIYIKTGNGSTISFNEDSDTSTFTAFEIAG
jgi:hypothetical protein